jgi:isopenicillin N synthase-like dioxygenase
MSGIPVLSLKPIVDGAPDADQAVARELLPILRSWGAFQLVDHGVPQAAMVGAFGAAARFFRLPVEERMAIRVGRDNRGYVPMHQTHYPGNKPDLKESFNVGRLALTPDDPDVKAGKPLHGVNRWPTLDGFRGPVEAYFNAVTALGGRLLGPLAISLDMTPAALRARYGKPVAFMRLFHYPPDSNVDEKEFGAAEHKDYGFLTILAQDANGGLEVRSPDNELVPVPPRTDAFVINVGDMLSEITGGRFCSPLHRVVNRSGVARYSIPYFFDPDFDATFATMPDVSAGQYLLNKFDKFYKYRQQQTAAAS